MMTLRRRPSAPSAPLGFSSGRISVHGEVPDMVVPRKCPDCLGRDVFLG